MNVRELESALDEKLSRLKDLKKKMNAQNEKSDETSESGPASSNSSG